MEGKRSTGDMKRRGGKGRKEKERYGERKGRMGDVKRREGVDG